MFLKSFRKLFISNPTSLSKLEIFGKILDNLLRFIQIDVHVCTFRETEVNT
jgi:hypothetical protein